MNSNIFISQLPKEKQLKIKNLISIYLTKEGFNDLEKYRIIKNVMSDRLTLIDDIVDINSL